MSENLLQDVSPEGIETILRQIRANQQAFDAARFNPRRFIPFWLWRTQYRLIKANEPLWDLLGMPQKPMEFEKAQGVTWSIVRWMFGA